MAYVIITEDHVYIDADETFPTGAIGPFDTEVDASNYIKNECLGMATVVELDSPRKED